MSKSIKLTKDPIWLLLKNVTIPASTGSLFQTFYNLVDTWFAGKISAEAIAAIADSSFVNWNLDLMFGIPEQSISMFKKDVEEALAYDPAHISLYGLEIHERTPFGKNPQILRWESEHQEEFEAMYLWATDRLEKAGLFQYEVSNFSKKAYEGRNNLLVWSGQEYLGVGDGAHSYHMQTRWGNTRSIRTYLQHLENNKPCWFNKCAMTRRNIWSNIAMFHKCITPAQNLMPCF